MMKAMLRIVLKREQLHYLWHATHRSDDGLDDRRDCELR